MAFPRRIQAGPLAILSLAVTAMCVQGAVVANYDFNTDTSSAPAELGATASGFARGDFTGGDGSVTTNAARSSTGNNYFVRTRLTPANATDAVSNGSYVQFTVTPGATPLALTTLDFSWAMTAGADFAFTGGMFIRSSIDNFASDLWTGSGSSETTFDPVTSAETISFSGAEYENLTGPVTFRFYVYDDSSETGNNGVVHRFDNIVLNAVPEPASAGLVALSLIGLACGRRRSA